LGTGIGEPSNETRIKIHRPDTREMIFFLVSGIIVGVPIALFFEQYADILCLQLPLLSGICSVVIFAPLIEEFAKVFPLFYRHGETQKSLMRLGFLIGFGFGIAEFFIYVFLVGVPWEIRVPQVFFHASSTAITAYGVATKRTWHFYLISVGLHFCINLFAFFSLPFVLIGSAVAYILTYYIAWKLYQSAKERFVETSTQAVLP
jgi:hypothetical protein